MLEYDWENSVGHWICSTAHLIRRQISSRLLREGITFRQWEVLAWLSTTGKCSSQSELADALGIEPHTMAGVVSRMQRDGLLDRKSWDQDRRKNQVIPTPKAEALWRKVSALSHGVRDQATRGFSEDELKTLDGFLARIRRNVDSPSQNLLPTQELLSEEDFRDVVPQHLTSESL